MKSAKLKKLLFVAIVIAMPFVLSPAAHATMSVTFSDGANSYTVVDGGAGDLLGVSNAIFATNGSFGSIRIGTVSISNTIQYMNGVGYYSLQLTGTGWKTLVAGKSFTVTVTDSLLSGANNLVSSNFSVGGTSTVAVTGSAHSFDGAANISGGILPVTTALGNVSTPTGEFSGPAISVTNLGFSATFALGGTSGAGFGPSMTLEAVVPEPGTLLLLGFGLAGLGLYRLRRVKF